MKKSAPQTVRQRLAAILPTRYAHPGRLEEDILDILHGVPADETIAAVIDLLLAGKNVPPTGTKSDAKPTFDPAAFSDPSADMREAFHGLEFGCRYFHEGLPAAEVAARLWQQLVLARERFGVLGEAAFLHILLGESNHFPYTDVIHRFAPVDIEAVRAAVLRESQLFAELAVIMRGEDSIPTAANWLASVECDEATRAALMYGALHELLHEREDQAPSRIVVLGLGGPMSPSGFGFGSILKMFRGNRRSSVPESEGNA